METERLSPSVPPLRWHVPLGQTLDIRFQLKRLGCTTVVFLVLLLFLTPDPVRWPALGVVILAALLLGVGLHWRTSQQLESKEYNVGLDEQGFFWQTSQLETHRLPREKLLSYCLTQHPYTQRQVISLQFLLPDDYCSQPIELHAPVNAEEVRRWIAQHWQLREATQLPDTSSMTSFDLQLDISLERQQLIIQSKVSELERLLRNWQDLAQGSLPMLGAMPKEHWFGTQEDSLAIILAPARGIDFELITLPPTELRMLADTLLQQLAQKSVNVEYDFRHDNGALWKIRLQPSST